MLIETTLENWRQWEQVKELIAPMDKWCFRGQNDSNWELKTTLERPFIKTRTLKEFAFDENQFEREKKILFHFKRGARNYSSKLPSNNDDNLDWLSLIQHYGGLTRLLDFSYSLYIAAYFSVTSAVKQSTIWAINLPKIDKNIKTRYDINYNSYEEKIIQHNKLSLQYIDNKDRNEKDNIILNIDPNHINDRMSLQKGLFLFPCNIEEPFEYNLSSMFGFGFENISSHTQKIKLEDIDSKRLYEYLLIKFNLPKITHNPIKYDLLKMNITSATLFPGLDGFTKSLSQFLFRSI